MNIKENPGLFKKAGNLALATVFISGLVSGIADTKKAHAERTKINAINSNLIIIDAEHLAAQAQALTQVTEACKVQNIGLLQNPTPTTSPLRPGRIFVLCEQGSIQLEKLKQESDSKTIPPEIMHPVDTHIKKPVKLVDCENKDGKKTGYYQTTLTRDYTDLHIADPKNEYKNEEVKGKDLWQMPNGEIVIYSKPEIHYGFDVIQGLEDRPSELLFTFTCKDIGKM